MQQELSESQSDAQENRFDLSCGCQVTQQGSLATTPSSTSTSQRELLAADHTAHYEGTPPRAF